MNTSSSISKHNKAIFAAVVSLMLAVLISTAMLFSCFVEFIQPDNRHYIPLTQSGGLTSVVERQPGEAAAPAAPVGPSGMLVANPMLTAEWFRAYDKKTVWEGETEIEIFRVCYKNGEGQITVKNQDSEKLIAPGTENVYDFALKNTCSDNVEYTMSMEAKIRNNSGVELPVQVKVFDKDGNYYAGSADQWAKPMELNAVSTTGTLKPGYVQEYTLMWQWPFEGDDALDTELGNFAANDEDITLTIEISTTASYTPKEGGGRPQTGDTSQILAYSIVMLISLTALILLLFFARSKREERNG